METHMSQTHSSSALSQDFKRLEKVAFYEKPSSETTSFGISNTPVNKHEDATTITIKIVEPTPPTAKSTTPLPSPTQSPTPLPTKTNTNAATATTTTIPPLSHPSDGTIAQRRKLSRKLRNLNIKRQRSRANLRAAHTAAAGSRSSSMGYRSFSLEKPLDTSAIDSRRALNRSMRVKRLACQRVLAKKASVEGSEMWFFGEYRPNQEGLGCVVS